MANKQALVLAIYQILKVHSDENHPLQHKQILELLKKEYDIECDRQAVKRNLDVINDFGFQVISNGKKAGVFLGKRDFEPSELRLLIDSVYYSKHISNKQAEDLIEKLTQVGGEHFKSRVRHVFAGDSSRTTNDLFYNLDKIDEAIEKNKQISFNYYKYNVNKELEKTRHHVVSPYQFIIQGQHYYLVCKEERWQNLGLYRIDKIKDIKITYDPITPINTIAGYENGIDYSNFSSTHPYPFSDLPIEVTIKANKTIVDDIIDWFGHDIEITEDTDKSKINVKLTTSPTAMIYWALQYGKSVEIVKPESLRDKIKDDIRSSYHEHYFVPKDKDSKKTN